MLLNRVEPAPEEDDYLVYNYNRFQACRFGLDGNCVHPKTHVSQSIREDILETLGRIEAHAIVLGSQAAMKELRRVVMEDGSHARFLRKQYSEEGGVEGMVDAAVRAFRQGVTL
jgi:carboxylate-amine ligase